MRNQFKRTLFEVAIKNVTNKGYHFSQGAEDILKYLINEGVDKMTENKYKSSAYNQMAIRIIERSVDTMIEYARSRGFYDILEEQELEYAKATLCPTWPICQGR